MSPNARDAPRTSLLAQRTHSITGGGGAAGPWLLALGAPGGPPPLPRASTNPVGPVAIATRSPRTSVSAHPSGSTAVPRFETTSLPAAEPAGDQAQPGPRRAQYDRASYTSVSAAAAGNRSSAERSSTSGPLGKPEPQPSAAVGACAKSGNAKSPQQQREARSGMRVRRATLLTGLGVALAAFSALAPAALLPVLAPDLGLSKPVVALSAAAALLAGLLSRFVVGLLARRYEPRHCQVMVLLLTAPPLACMALAASALAFTASWAAIGAALGLLASAHARLAELAGSPVRAAATTAAVAAWASAGGGFSLLVMPIIYEVVASARGDNDPGSAWRCAFYVPAGLHCLLAVLSLLLRGPEPAEDWLPGKGDGYVCPQRDPEDESWVRWKYGSYASTGSSKVWRPSSKKAGGQTRSVRKGKSSKDGAGGTDRQGEEQRSSSWVRRKGEDRREQGDPSSRRQQPRSRDASVRAGRPAARRAGSGTLLSAAPMAASPASVLDWPPTVTPPATPEMPQPTAAPALAPALAAASSAEAVEALAPAATVMISLLARDHDSGDPWWQPAPSPPLLDSSPPPSPAPAMLEPPAPSRGPSFKPLQRRRAPPSPLGPYGELSTAPSWPPDALVCRLGPADSVGAASSDVSGILGGAAAARGRTVAAATPQLLGLIGSNEQSLAPFYSTSQSWGLGGGPSDGGAAAASKGQPLAEGTEAPASPFRRPQSTPLLLLPASPRALLQPPAPASGGTFDSPKPEQARRRSTSFAGVGHVASAASPISVASAANPLHHSGSQVLWPLPPSPAPKSGSLFLASPGPRKSATLPPPPPQVISVRSVSVTLSVSSIAAARSANSRSVHRIPEGSNENSESALQSGSLRHAGRRLQNLGGGGAEGGDGGTGRQGSGGAVAVGRRTAQGVSVTASGSRRNLAGDALVRTGSGRQAPSKAARGPSPLLPWRQWQSAQSRQERRSLRSMWAAAAVLRLRLMFTVPYACTMGLTLALASFLPYTLHARYGLGALASGALAAIPLLLAALTVRAAALIAAALRRLRLTPLGRLGVLCAAQALAGVACALLGACGAQHGPAGIVGSAVLLLLLGLAALVAGASPYLHLLEARTQGPALGPAVGPALDPAVVPALGPALAPALGPALGPTSEHVSAVVRGRTWASLAVAALLLVCFVATNRLSYDQGLLWMGVSVCASAAPVLLLAC
ncbi:hypothetical protein HYH03_005762 [Edaphochlamys debaryana]|uniref:Major facilitator superfamily (MFS) profile domain-containing protein n=1 Tax=Edaphochlamys debaryana TaxID=47281 RepID=A0A835YC53_9CHLO|nr:hypothetical protein HYH03_005762 [Edaphochlamys debaryana]|eukprot:KAG2496160.1 hypothetical protein HYH03_005762 [Edaphochlamys debaryana]